MEAYWVGGLVWKVAYECFNT